MDRSRVITAVWCGVLAVTAAVPAATADPPGSGDATTSASTHCRVEVHGAWEDGGSTHGAVRPVVSDPVALLGQGNLNHRMADGRHVVMKASFLRCRRDGGRVPPHGGANIADMRGTGQIVGGDAPMDVTFEMHVEDRGEGQFNADDFVAVMLRDLTGAILYHQANFLSWGTVRLIPV